MAETGTKESIVAPLAIDVADRIARIDQKRLRAYRLGRLRAELRKRDYMGCLLTDPMNIRYATGSRNMQVWTMHSPGRCAMVQPLLGRPSASAARAEELGFAPSAGTTIARTL